MVRAADTLFISVVVYNNRGGVHREILDRWREPSWNNPVVRFIDGGEKPLTPRLTHRVDARGVLQAMVTALSARSRPIPAWLGAAAR